MVGPAMWGLVALYWVMLAGLSWQRQNACFAAPSRSA